MKELYIDTTTSYLYTGLIEDGKVICEIKKNYGKDLSSAALNEISKMLKDMSMEPEDIDRIIVVNGPGSFTGIRVGVTIAKVYAYSLNKEIITVSSLAAMALSSSADGKYKVPIIDARRDFVYAGIYDQDGNTVLKDSYISIEALKIAVENLPFSYKYISNQEFENLEVEKYDPNIEKIVNFFKNAKPENPHGVNPIYLKLTEAEEKQKLEII